MLLEKDADVNVQGGSHGDSALYVAWYGGHMAVVRLLREKNVDVNVQGGEYGTALQAHPHPCCHPLP